MFTQKVLIKGVEPAKTRTQKEFADCCNEFWWVSTYVAKGLCRDEIIYAKGMLEIQVRAIFLK